MLVGWFISSEFALVQHMESKRVQSASGNAAVSGSQPIKPNVAEHLVLMCASALFSGLEQHECNEIASCARVRTFARNEILFAQGDPNRNMTMLLSGSVKLTQISSGGNEVLLWMSGRGDAVNVSPESDSCSHTCSAKAVEQCKAMVWEYSRLKSLLDQFPQIRNNINRILALRLNELEERFREVATEKAAKRLARTLMRLLKQVGKPAIDGVQVSLSREELAQMTGTTLFTISRILSKWAEQGFVVPRREAVVVKNQKLLELAWDQDE
jgi:CRP-like cAMP-binding protein